MPSRLLLCLAVFVSLIFAAPAQAAPGALDVLVTGNNEPYAEELAIAISDEPGISSVAFAYTNVDTPAAEDLAEFDLVVSLGDSTYLDPEAWGDSLADYVDAGGVVLQAAYDNWDEVGNSPAPTGRFESDGYPPLLLGPNENFDVTLGTILLPDHPLVQGLGTFPTGDNTTTALAPGATLLAKWSDDRNAIAFKGRVVATSASPGETETIPGIARLARNTGNYFGDHNVTVGKSGTGFGTVTSSSAGILCGAVCGGVFAFGTQFAFTAAPAPDSRFKGWSGACSGVGPCQPMIAGSDLSIGAVFDLAGFGPKTQVTLSPRSSKISSNGRLKIRIKNSNDFSVQTTLSGRTSGKLRTSKLRYVKLKSKSASIQAAGTKTVQLTLPKSLRRIMVQKGKLKLLLTAKIKDPAGGTRTVNKRLTVKPKS